MKKILSLFLSLIVFAGISLSFPTDAHALKMTRREMKILKKAKFMRKRLFKKGSIKFRILAKRVMKKYKKLKRRKFTFL